MEPLLKGMFFFVVNLSTVCSCVHQSICIIKRFGVFVCSGESGSESSSEGSEGNSQNVSSAPSFLFCMHYVYTRIKLQKIL